MAEYLPDDQDALAGKDAWGQDLIYEYRRTGTGELAVIRSVGANGVDEAGGGDDLQVEAEWVESS